VFYNIKKGKIIDSGTSSLLKPHSVLLNTHAEEIALKRIFSIHIKKNKLKDLTLIIWKQNNHGLVKPINCCKWCTKLVEKYGFPANQVMTFNQEFDEPFSESTNTNILRPAIVDEPVIPLTKCQFH
jgi:hypothetical protein